MSMSARCGLRIAALVALACAPLSVGAGAAAFPLPPLAITGLAAGGGNLFVALSQGQVIKIAPGGQQQNINLPRHSRESVAIAADGAGDLYAAVWLGSGGSAVVRVAASGRQRVIALPGLGQDPQAVAVDRDGDLYVAAGQRLVKVTRGGAVTPIGSGWRYLLGLAVDAAGNLYVADTAIYKIAPDGTRTELDSKGLVAGGIFRQIATGPRGGVYTCCGEIFGGAHGARAGLVRFPAPGVQETAAPAILAPQLDPRRFPPRAMERPIAVDSHGDVFVAGTGMTIVEVLPGGVESQVGTAWGDAIAVAAGAQGVILAEAPPPSPAPPRPVPPSAGHLVRLSSGSKSVLASGGEQPAALAAGGAGSVVFVAQDGRHVFRLSPAVRPVPIRVSGLDHAYGLAVDARGDIFLADSNHNRVLRIAPNGAQSSVGHGLRVPVGLATDPAGNLYVTEPLANQVVKISPDGSQARIEAPGLRDPLGVAVGPAGNLYIADSGNNRVLELARRGAELVLPVTVAATGIAVDSAGSVFLVDGAAGAVKLTAGGTIRSIRLRGFSAAAMRKPPPATPPLTAPVLVPAAPPPALVVNNQALYLLAANCHWADYQYRGTEVGLYYAARTAKLAALRGLGFSGCDLRRVYDDEAGQWFVLGPNGLVVIHEARPAAVDRYDARLAPQFGALPLLPLGGLGEINGLTPAVGARGRHYLLIADQAVPYHRGAPMVVWRFLAEPTPDQPRIQPGSWSDYAQLRYNGSIAPGDFQNEDDQLKGGNVTMTGMAARIVPGGVLIPGEWLHGYGAQTVLRPPPPAPLGLATVLAATARFVVLAASAPAAAKPRTTPVYVLDRRSASWRTLRLPLARDPTARVFGDWLALPPDPSGTLVLVNLGSLRRLAIHAGRRGAEVLTAGNGGVVYRDGDRILLAPFAGAGLGPARLLASGPAAADVHWAFWANPTGMSSSGPR